MVTRSCSRVVRVFNVPWQVSCIVVGVRVQAGTASRFSTNHLLIQFKVGFVHLLASASTRAEGVHQIVRQWNKLVVLPRRRA